MFRCFLIKMKKEANLGKETKFILNIVIGLKRIQMMVLKVSKISKNVMLVILIPAIFFRKMKLAMQLEKNIKVNSSRKQKLVENN